MAGKKICIFDDKPEIAELIKMILERHGYQTVVFHESADAIAKIEKEKPDLILIDIMMPEKDGYQVCDEVRCNDAIKHIPVIVVTGTAVEKEVINQAFETYGARDYLVKPFEPDELLEKIRKHMGP